MSTTPTPLRRASKFGRRYGPVLVGLAVTVGSMLLALFWDESPPVLLLVAAVGSPISAYLLAHAAAGGGVSLRRILTAGVLGATLVPVLVLTVSGAVFSLVYGLVEPLTGSASDLLDDLRFDPTLVDVLTSPWALVFLVELALVAPLVEETFKPLGARLLRPGWRREAFLLGAAAGAGFAAIEDVLYASGWFASAEWWLPVAVLRSTGAALHILGAGLISLALYERRTGEGRGRVGAMWGLAVGIHAFWNGSIAVAIILFEELDRDGASLSWGVALSAVLGTMGMLLLGSLVVAGRWSSADAGERVLELTRPTVIAGWAGLAALMIVPTVILLLAFPGFVAL